jgi:hypothetical protein
MDMTGYWGTRVVLLRVFGSGQWARRGRREYIRSGGLIELGR